MFGLAGVGCKDKIVIFHDDNDDDDELSHLVVEGGNDDDDATDCDIRPYQLLQSSYNII